VKFSASAILWPSSTKAEMLACLIALMVAPVKAMVTIHTDSAMTIIGFNKLADLMQLSIRKREKVPNFQIWMTITHMIESKNLKVNLVKVKAHSGDRLNDRADKLAKTAAFLAPRLNLNYLWISGLNLEIACDNLTLKISSRRCIKTICDSRHFYQLLQL